MKHCLLLASLLLSTWGSAPAQTLSFDQAALYGTTTSPLADRSGVADIALDAQGNRYVAGSFSGTVRFGTIARRTEFGSDAFVAKISPAGTTLWVVQGGGFGNDVATCLALDPMSGDVLVAGDFESPTATFGATTLTRREGSLSESDIWVGRLNAATGAWRAVNSASSIGTDNALDLAVDPAGNVLLAGVYGESASFGALRVVAPSECSILAKLSPANTWLWAVRGAVAAGSIIGTGLAVDAEGNAYWTGALGPSATFGTTTLRSAGQQDWFVAKLNPAGAYQWAVRAGGPGADQVQRLRRDAAGNLYVLGTFSGTASFGATTLTSAGESDVVVARLSPAGSFQWAARGGGGGAEYPAGLAVEANGTSYLTGSYQGRGSTADYGATTLRAVGTSASDLFVARLDAQGRWAGALSGGDAGEDYGSGVAVDNQGHASVVGGIGGFGATLGSFRLMGGSSETGLLVQVGGTLLAARSARPAEALTAAPNPAAGLTRLRGAAPGQVVEVRDALGRLVATATMPARGPLTLALPSGWYIVRAGVASARLVVQ